MKRRFNFFAVTLAIVLFAIAADIFIIYQFGNYEERFLELYGGEQDGYVRIILEQIKRLGDEASEEEITEVISSLDSTASRYWTLSRGDSILFVKSVTETNRYKGLNRGTYYASESASEFMNSLAVNEVAHRIIYLDDDRFVASGMIFGWRGEQYRICLLTYDRVILEDNILLETKNAIVIVLSLILAILVLISMMMSRKISRQSSYIDRQEERVVWQNQQIALLDGQLKKENAFSARRQIFHGAVMGLFLDALDERNIYPLHFAVFETESVQGRDEFFEHMQAVLDNHVLRFFVDRRYVVLIFVRYEHSVSERIIAALEDWDVRKLATHYCEDNMNSYQSVFDEFWEKEVTVA